MVSPAFQELENRAGQALVLHEELVQEIATKVGHDPATVERILLLTALVTGGRQADVAWLVYQFLTYLAESRMQEPVQSPPESPFLGGHAV